MDKKRDIFEEGIYTVKEEFCSVPYDRMIAALDIFLMITAIMINYHKT